MKIVSLILALLVAPVAAQVTPGGGIAPNVQTTGFTRTLLDDASAADARATLGVAASSGGSLTNVSAYGTWSIYGELDFLTGSKIAPNSGGGDPGGIWNFKSSIDTKDGETTLRRKDFNSGQFGTINSDTDGISIASGVPLTNAVLTGGTVTGQTNSSLTANRGIYTASNQTLSPDDSGILNVKWFGAVGDGVSDDTSAITSAFSASTGIVYLPSGTYLISSSLTLPDGLTLLGAGKEVAIISATQTATPTLILSGNNTVSGIKCTSPYTNAFNTYPTNNFNAPARQISLNNNVLLDSVHVEYAAQGFDGTRAYTNITLRNISARGIRNWGGYGAGVHTASCTNVFISGVRLVDCDRGIESEEGGDNVHAQNGYLQDIYTSGYGVITNYNFVLDAHTHATSNTCHNITYQNFFLTNCQTFISAKGADATSRADGVYFKNIYCYGITNVPGNDTRPIELKASRGVVIENVIIDGIPTTQAENISVQSDAADSVFRKVRHLVGPSGGRAVYVQSGSTNTVIEDCDFYNFGGAPDSYVGIEGTSAALIRNRFHNIKGANAIVFLYPASDSALVDGNYISEDSSDTMPNAGIRARGKRGRIVGNRILSDHTTSGWKPIQVDAATPGTDGIETIVTGNQIYNASVSGSGYFLNIASSSQRHIVKHNTCNSDILRIDDLANNNGIISENIMGGGNVDRPANELYRATAVATVANTTNETSLVGTGHGSMTLPATYFRADAQGSRGKGFRLVASGTYSTAGAAGTIQIRIKAGTTVILDTSAKTAVNSVSAQPWNIDAVLRVGTYSSVTGTLVGNAIVEHQDGATAAIYGWPMVNGAATFNNAAAFAVGLTVEWGTADAANTITCNTLSLEAL